MLIFFTPLHCMNTNYNNSTISTLMEGSRFEIETSNFARKSSRTHFRPPSEEQEFITNLTMGIEETLRAHPMITDVKISTKPYVSCFMLTSWERRHGFKLPGDLRNFYSSTNGFRLTWSLVYADELLKIGDLCINTIQELIPIDTNLEVNDPDAATMVPDPYKLKPSTAITTISLTDVQKSLRVEENKPEQRCKLAFGPNIKAFKLDSSHPDWGTICLVYRNDESKPRDNEGGPMKSQSQLLLQEGIEPEIQIWFLDRALQWHFLAPTFKIFYRMALFHLGLPEWMYRFTPFGISSWIEQIFWLVAPNLLQPIENLKNPNTDEEIWSTEIPPEAAKPNPNLNILNLSMFKKKNKDHRKS